MATITKHSSLSTSKNKTCERRRDAADRDLMRVVVRAVGHRMKSEPRRPRPPETPEEARDRRLMREIMRLIVARDIAAADREAKG